MIVDDMSILRLTLKNILVKLGFEVVAEASNGFEAINLYEKYKPDLVTMDITMPGVNGIKNGIDALVKIKEMNSEAKVVMITSHGEEKMIIDAISKGAKGYILKPVTEDKVKEILKRLNFLE